MAAGCRSRPVQAGLTTGSTAAAPLPPPALQPVPARAGDCRRSWVPNSAAKRSEHGSQAALAAPSRPSLIRRLLLGVYMQGPRFPSPGKSVQALRAGPGRVAGGERRAAHGAGGTAATFSRAGGLGSSLPSSFELGRARPPNGNSAVPPRQRQSPPPCHQCIPIQPCLTSTPLQSHCPASQLGHRARPGRAAPARRRPGPGRD